MSRKKIGVVLAGCGVNDGSEIHEATLTLLFLDRANASAIIMAPDIKQMDVVNHQISEAVSSETRDVIVESARIARDAVENIKNISANDLDAVIFPGGFGAAKNLCDFAVKGENLTVNHNVEQLILEMHKAKKPVGFICIAPVIAAKVLGNFHPKITIGNDAGTAQIIEKFGAKHISCSVDDIVFDEENLVVTTPAYMLGPSISYVAKGIKKLVKKVIKLS
ncbi:MAG: isoprenoid biosynthesis glyoxalase ElbB [Candidatus Cloacimonetes bacterium]|nr:isoprenoid biosynthesis glyoxalase ElbB [Candidatus Cloacimonadota bacterium]